MANTYTNILVHAVFSTKNREPFISPDLSERLYPYMGGIAGKNEFKVLAIGGTKDHVHILLSLPPKISPAKSIQLIKGGSSKWIHETFPNMKRFAWQEGYGAFSIGIAQLDPTKKYIEKQEEHHHKKSFEEEYIEFLRKNNTDFDEKFIFG